MHTFQKFQVALNKSTDTLQKSYIFNSSIPTVVHQLWKKVLLTLGSLLLHQWLQNFLTWIQEEVLKFWGNLVYLSNWELQKSEALAETPTHIKGSKKCLTLHNTLKWKHVVISSFDFYMRDTQHIIEAQYTVEFCLLSPLVM